MYWFKEKDARIIVDKLHAFHGSAAIWQNNPMLQTWVRNHIAYYSNIIEPSEWDTSLLFSGEQGELVKMLIPKARHLTRQLVTLVTKEKLSFNAIAKKQGRDVHNDLKLGNALSEKIIDGQDLDLKQEDLTEGSFITGVNFSSCVFRTDLGELFTGAQTRRGSRPLYTGEIEITVDAPTDVLWNWRIKEWDRQPWVERRTKKNRWDMIAQFPKLSERIQSLPSCSDEMGFGDSHFHGIEDDDFINVYEVYHRPTPALPKGRMVVYSDPLTIYFDGDNPYETIPIEPMCPERIQQVMLGYPMFSNLLPAQEMFDHSYSALATNQSAFAVQNILTPRGSGLEVQDIAGMNFVSYTPQPGVPGGGKPEALQLTQSSPQTRELIDMLGSVLEDMSNMNGALRGSPPPGITSGTAIATLTTNALEFISYANKALSRCMEKTMNHGFNAYKRFANVEHKISMVGRHFQATEETFTGKDLDGLSDAKIVRSNPMMQTMGGRSYLAETLAKSGMITDVQKFIGILEGQVLRTLYEPEALQNELVEEENEVFMDGGTNQVLSIDDHGQHILHHASLLNDVEIRNNGPMAGAIMEHIMEHLELAKNTDPMFMAMAQTGKMPQAGPEQKIKGDLPPVPGGAGPQVPGTAAKSPAKIAKDQLGRG